MKQNKQLTLLSMLLLIAIFLLSSCQPVPANPSATQEVKESAPATTEKAAESPVAATEAAPSASAKAGTITYGFQAKPKSLDPSVWTGGSDNQVMRQIYDSLVYSPEPGVYKPWLAKEWTISDDGLTYTFVLRDGVKFHDGTPLTAEVFKFTYERMLDPKTQSLRTGDLGPIDKIEVVNDTTFKLIYKKPFAPLMANASVMPLSPVSPAAVAKYGTDFAQHPVGTGPFMFEKWEGNDLHLVRNPDYKWAPAEMKHTGPAYLEKIIFKEVQEAATRMVALQTKEINYTHNPVYEDVKDLEGMGFTIYRLKTPGWVKSLPLNIEYPPTDDLKVRQAILYGINRQQIVDVVVQGYADVSYGILTRTTFGYDPAIEKSYPYDPDKAAALLEEAGWVDANKDGIREKDGKNLTLKMIMFDGGINKPLAELAQAMFVKMGFDTTLEVSAYDAFAEQVAQGEFNTAEMNWNTLDPSVVTFNMLYSSEVTGGGMFNRSHVKEKLIDDLIDRGMQTTNQTERAKIYSEIQKWAIDNAVVLPLYDSAVVNITAQNVKDVSFNQVGAPEFYNAWVE